MNTSSFGQTSAARPWFVSTAARLSPTSQTSSPPAVKWSGA